MLFTRVIAKLCVLYELKHCCCFDVTTPSDNPAYIQIYTRNTGHSFKLASDYELNRLILFWMCHCFSSIASCMQILICKTCQVLSRIRPDQLTISERYNIFSSMFGPAYKQNTNLEYLSYVFLIWGPFCSYIRLVNLSYIYCYVGSGI